MRKILQQKSTRFRTIKSLIVFLRKLVYNSQLNLLTHINRLNLMVSFRQFYRIQNLMHIFKVSLGWNYSLQQLREVNVVFIQKARKAGHSTAKAYRLMLKPTEKQLGHYIRNMLAMTKMSSTHFKSKDGKQRHFSRMRHLTTAMSPGDRQSTTYLTGLESQSQGMLVILPLQGKLSITLSKLLIQALRIVKTWTFKNGIGINANKLAIFTLRYKIADFKKNQAGWDYVRGETTSKIRGHHLRLEI